METQAIKCPNPDCAQDLPIDLTGGAHKIVCPYCELKFQLPVGTWAGAAEFDDLLDDQGQALSAFEPAGQIAEGGMGAILQGRDRILGRQTALKTILPHMREGPSQQLRFVIEAQITGQLEHPNIVPIHQLGRDNAGNLFYTMKLVKGHTLADLLESGTDTKSINELLGIFLKTCDAISFAHSRSVIHRDLKPENIMLGDYGEVLVMDWGLAKALKTRSVMEPAPQLASKISSTAETVATLSGMDPDTVAEAVNFVPDELVEADSNTIRNLRADSRLALSIEGQIQGTPAFMAPEQARGQLSAMGPWTDIYAMGAILYYILTVKPPVRGSTLLSTIQRVAEGQVIPPDERTPDREIPPELSAIVMTAMALEPADRYDTVADLISDVRRYLDGHAVSVKQDTFAESVAKLIRRNRRRAWAAGATIAVTIALTTSFITTLMVNEHRANQSETDARQRTKRANDAKAMMAQELQRAESARERLVLQLEESKKQAALAALEEQRADEDTERARTAAQLIAGAGGGEVHELRIKALERAARSNDDAGLRLILNAVPADERDHNWKYFNRKLTEPIPTPDEHAPPITTLSSGPADLAATGQRIKGFVSPTDLVTHSFIPPGKPSAGIRLHRLHVGSEKVTYLGAYFNARMPYAGNPILDPALKTLVVPTSAGGGVGGRFNIYPNITRSQQAFAIRGEFESIQSARIGGNRKTLVVEGTFRNPTADPSAVYILPLHQRGRWIPVAGLTTVDQKHLPLVTGSDDRFVQLAARLAEQPGFGRTELRLFSAATGEPVRTTTLKDHVLTSAVSRTGELSAFAGKARIIRIYQGGDLSLHAEFRAHDAQINHLAFHPTEDIIASAGADQKVKIWNHRRQQLLAELRHPEEAGVLMFTPAGDRLYTDRRYWSLDKLGANR